MTKGFREIHENPERKLFEQLLEHSPTHSDFDLDLADLEDGIIYEESEPTIPKSTLSTDEAVEQVLADFEDMETNINTPGEQKHQTTEKLHSPILRENMMKNYCEVDKLASHMILSDGNNYDKMNRIGNELIENSELINRRLRNILAELDDRRTPTEDLGYMIGRVGKYMEESLDNFKKLNYYYKEMKNDFEQYVHHSFGYHGTATRCMDEKLIEPSELEDMQFYTQQRFKHSHSFCEKENDLIKTYEELQEFSNTYNRLNNALHEHPRFKQIDGSATYRFEQINREFVETSRDVTDNFIQECGKRKEIVVNHVHELEQLYGKIDITLEQSGLEYVDLAIPDFEEIDKDDSLSNIIIE